jgi:GDP-4-dehydro-6-deoxy-D-mannose reductase
MKVLVSGINGFVGKHLTRALGEAGHEVAGVSREETSHPEITPLITDYYQCDLADPESVNKLDLQDIDAIISLAGLANVGQSFDQAERYKQINVAVLSNLCQRLVDQGLQRRVVAVSTGAVYDSDQAMPLTEASRLMSVGSPYALSKIEMEKVALGFRENGLPEVIVVRPFNHIGPGQEPGFLVPDTFEKITHALASDKILKLGTISTKRDYTDVRDVVVAYTGLATLDSAKLTEPIYNVCSGVPRSGEEILGEFKKNIPGAESLTITVDPLLVRPNDPPELFGDNTKLVQAIGWQPQIPLEQTIKDFVASKA